MMRYIGTLVCALAFVVCAASLGYAATDATFPVSASIQEQLELTGWVKEMGPGETDPGLEGTELSFPCSMEFGTGIPRYLTSELTDGSDAGGLYSPTWYAVFMVAKTSGRPYKIESDTDSFAGTDGSAIGHNLDKSFILTPQYEAADEWTWGGGGSAPQGPDPNAGTTGYDVGDQVLAVGKHTVYNSGTGGASRIIRAFYSLPPYPDPADPPAIAARPTGWEIISASKPEGTYETDVYISLTLTTP
ncbi:MAG: hypothetical protein JW869_04770 [Candidatus Omnitrophica bacterium]|nr:hypothetical protein [Candidatus Omnitrophota bacterium]